MLTQQDLRFQERIEVRLIELNAVVTDRQGHRVYGLKADDFEIYEGRTKQAITNFTEYRPTPAPAPVASAEAPAVPSEPVALPQHAREPHSLLILVDALPRTDLVRQKTFQQMDDLLSKIVRPGDHVSLLYWEPDYKRPRSIVESTDPAAVMSAFRDFARAVKPDTGATSAAASAADDVHAYGLVKAGTAGKNSPIDFDAQRDASEQFAAENRLLVLHKKCESMRRLVEAMGTRPGKKAVLYVSDDFRLVGEDPAFLAAKRYIDEITRAANANGVTFYAVHSAPVADPTDASNPDPVPVNADDVILSTGALQRLTDPTGGLLDFNRSAIADLAPAIADDLESYYSIAYQAKSDGGDRVRNVTIRTKNPAYRVRARTEVVEKSMATKAKEAIVSRLFVDEGANDIQFEVHEGALKRTSGNRWLLPLFVKIPASQLQFADERGKRTAHAGVLIASANGVAEVTPVSENELRIVDPQDLDNGFVTYSVEILGDKRGSKVSIGVVDRRTGAIGVRTIDNRGRFH
jgi:VWFA-related protein